MGGKSRVLSAVPAWIQIIPLQLWLVMLLIVTSLVPVVNILTLQLKMELKVTLVPLLRSSRRPSKGSSSSREHPETFGEETEVLKSSCKGC